MPETQGVQSENLPSASSRLLLCHTFVNGCNPAMEVVPLGVGGRLVWSTPPLVLMRHSCAPLSLLFNITEPRCLPAITWLPTLLEGFGCPRPVTFGLCKGT